MVTNTHTQGITTVRHTVNACPMATLSHVNTDPVTTHTRIEKTTVANGTVDIAEAVITMTNHIVAIITEEEAKGEDEGDTTETSEEVSIATGVVMTITMVTADITVIIISLIVITVITAILGAIAVEGVTVMAILGTIHETTTMAHSDVNARIAGEGKFKWHND